MATTVTRLGNGRPLPTLVQLTSKSRILACHLCASILMRQEVVWSVESLSRSNVRQYCSVCGTRLDSGK